MSICEHEFEYLTFAKADFWRSCRRCERVDHFTWPEVGRWTVGQWQTPLEVNGRSPREEFLRLRVLARLTNDPYTRVLTW